MSIVLQVASSPDRDEWSQRFGGMIKWSPKYVEGLTATAALICTQVRREPLGHSSLRNGLPR